ncbi:MFS transporter [Rossellomorea aquimaris]|uniref:Permease n=1 Tax=Rossellomorea aquimaris TaxID=189382 RepID=A0A1J6W6B4_9BACI|nr:MFS transporter [Rossellomorea aquimaris]OIU73189.1 permease [Rossellomorea aquimaris]
MTEVDKNKQATYHLWIFSISKFISTFGNSIYSFGISLYILELTGSAFGFAINLICSVLPRILFAPVSGYLADRYSKKFIILSSQSLAALVVGGLLVYNIFFSVNIVAIYMTTFLLSISTMFTGITFTSSVSSLIDENRIQKAMAINQASVSSSAIAGPILGGLMYGFDSLNVFLLTQMVSYAVAALLESTMKFQLYSTIADQNPIREKFIKSISSGYGYIKSQDILWTILRMALLINLFSVSMVVGMPYITVKELGIDSFHFGVIEGFFAGGMLGSSLYFSIRKELTNPLIVVKRGIILIAFLLAASTLPVLLTFSYNINVFYYITLAFLYGVTLTCINTPIGVMFQKGIKEEFKGRVFGLLETISQAMSPLGMIIFGLSFDWIGIGWSMIPSAFFLVAITTIMLRPSIIRGADPTVNQP